MPVCRAKLSLRGRFGSPSMRPFLALLVCALLLAACSKPAPPVGRWEGTYESGDTFVAARLEIAGGSQIRISAPDVTDGSVASEEDRVQMRQNMAGRLAG